jgi:hypothetical protein
LENVLSWLFGALVALIVYIFKAVRDEMRQDREQRNVLFGKVDEKIDRIEGLLSAMTGQLHDRITKVERSVDGLWGEHRILKNAHCQAFHHSRKSDNEEEG